MSKLSYAAVLKMNAPVEDLQRQLLTTEQRRPIGRNEKARKSENDGQDEIARDVEVAEHVETNIKDKAEADTHLETPREGGIFTKVEVKPNAEANVQTRVGFEDAGKIQIMTVERHTEVETIQKDKPAISRAGFLNGNWQLPLPGQRTASKWEEIAMSSPERIIVGNDAYRLRSISLSPRQSRESEPKSKPVRRRKISDIIEETYREKWPGRHVSHYSPDVPRGVRDSAESGSVEPQRNDWVEWLREIR